jgi:uncharacterized protein
MPPIDFIGLYLVLGTFTGFMAGLLGVGGGGILVPLLASLFAWQGMNKDHVIPMALGTAMTCMIVSSAASIRAHAARNAIVWRVVLGMTPGIMVGAFLTTHLAVNINSIYIAIFFSLFMAIVAIQMFMNWKPTASKTPIHFHGLAMTGAGIGSISALAAVGGGFLSVVYMGYKNIDLKKAIGTSSAIGFPIAVTGASGYMINGWSKTSALPFTLGYVYLPAFVAIAVSSVVAAPYGVRLSHGLPEAHLKKIFAIVSLALSIKMLVGMV